MEGGRLRPSMDGNGDLGLGIDTGGTYTDAAILRMDDGTVLSKAKALTTRNDLAVGIGNAIDKLDHSLFKHIRLLAVSSTLATNSVVEGKGCRVGLIVIGHDAVANIPVDELHADQGRPQPPGGEKRSELDMDAAQEFVGRVKDKVDAFAISGYLSVRNPEHEIAVKKMVQSLTPHPVVCGHELSSALGFNERTITAVLNARLIPIIADLIASHQAGAGPDEHQGPVDDREGRRFADGRVGGEGAAGGDHPVRSGRLHHRGQGPHRSCPTRSSSTSAAPPPTSASCGTAGPGSTRKGRCWAAGAPGSRRWTSSPPASAATPGSWWPGTVPPQPAARHPAVHRLHDLSCAPAEAGGAAGRQGKWVPSYMDLDAIPQTTEFYIFCKKVVRPRGRPGPGEGPRADQGQSPAPSTRSPRCSNVHPLSLNLRKMEALGMVLRIGLTPTDMLHAEGSYVDYDAEASKIGVEIQSANLEMPVPEFIRR